MSVSLKVIVVGNGMVGKTSMITRFATGRMTDGYKKTIGTGQQPNTPAHTQHTPYTVPHHTPHFTSPHPTDAAWACGGGG